MRTVLIGDVHGCLDELRALVRLAGVANGDRVILVGDLVAKGPDSPGVVSWARTHGALAVRGNHDDALLALHDPGMRNQARRKGRERQAAIADRLLPEDWAYLHALPLWIDLPEVCVRVVHGGLVPGLAPEATEPHDLMNLRSLSDDGRPSRRIDGGVPWASRWPGPEHVVFGHDAMRGLQRYPHATGLDTGCVYGGRLTALLLPDKQLVSVPARRVYAAIGGPSASRPKWAHDD